MSDDDGTHDSFEETVRAIAREISRSVERVTQVDLEEIAETIGVDPAHARQFVETAGRWLRSQAGGIGDEVAFPKPRPRDAVVNQDPLSAAGPHPLDLPTADQGLALAALVSGRWTVERGSEALGTHGDGPGPNDALGLVRELRARDWIAADGEVTQVGRHALSRWLDAADSH
jgi:hypothetical protein